MSSMLKLLPHQVEAVGKLRTGSILVGGVGSGKSLTALAYFYFYVCKGKIVNDLRDLAPPPKNVSLYIITTAMKRDSLDWETEASNFSLSKDPSSSVAGIHVTIDSWNNIKKYEKVENAFFIFDEQKLVGSGVWVKTFLRIAKRNNWILLTATPGDVWTDYLAIFLANGFYKNKTEFLKRHVVYNPFLNFPKVERYLEEDRLIRLRDSVQVEMRFERKIKKHNIDVIVPFDEKLFETVYKDRWNPYKNRPIRYAGEACYVMRRVVNSSPERVLSIKNLQQRHKKLIVFYNFNYELDILRNINVPEDCIVAEYNGHLHEDIPRSENWLYLVQYISGSEAWECVETNAIAFYSLNYSYKLITQASGRIDRMNTSFGNLYYYYLISNSIIDSSIIKAIKTKTNFNERKFVRDINITFG